MTLFGPTEQDLTFDRIADRRQVEWNIDQKCFLSCSSFINLSRITDYAAIRAKSVYWVLF